MQVLRVEEGRPGQYSDKDIGSGKREFSELLEHEKEELLQDQSEEDEKDNGRLQRTGTKKRRFAPEIGASNGKRIRKKQLASNYYEDADELMDEMEHDTEIAFMIKSKARRRGSPGRGKINRSCSVDSGVKDESKNTTSYTSSSSPPSSPNSSVSVLRWDRGRCTSRHIKVFTYLAMPLPTVCIIFFFIFENLFRCTEKAFVYYLKQDNGDVCFKCHQCMQESKTIVSCSKCENNSYCIRCIKEWYVFNTVPVLFLSLQ